MKVCFITQEFYPTLAGIAHVTEDFSRELIKDGDTVTIITPRIKGTKKKEEYKGMKVIRLNYPKTNFLKLDQISFILKSTLQAIKLKPDVIIAQQIIPSGLASGLSGLFIKTKTVTRALGRDIDIELEKKRFTRLLSKISFKLNDKLIALGDYHTNIIKKHTKRHIDILPHFIPDIKINQTKEECKKELKFKDKPNLVFVGRLIERKGVDILIKSVKDIDCQVHIIGEGPEKENLEQLTKELNLENKITFHGSIPHEKTLKFIKASDMFVFPTIKEALATVYLESILMETPVITTHSRNPGGTETRVFKHGYNSMLLDRNPESFNKAIKELIKNKKLGKTLAENALKSSTEYQPHNVIKRFKEIINS